MNRRPDATAHATHDLELVASYASGDAAGSELDAATTLVAGCADCAALHRDLRAIAAALPGLPVPVRPRDFRLTPEQAAALRPGGWRRIAAALAGPSFRFAAPLGTGLATLGLAGVLLGTLAGGPLLGAATSAAAPERNQSAGGVLGAAGAVASGKSALAPTAAPSMAASGAPSAAPTAAASIALIETAAPSFAPTAASAPPHNGPDPAASAGSGYSGPGDTSLSSAAPQGSPDIALTYGGSPAASDSRTTSMTSQGPATSAPNAVDAVGGGSSGPLVPAGALVLLAGLGLVGLRLASRRLA